MTDIKVFEDIHEIAENTAFLRAVEEREISLEMLDQLPSYEDLRDMEAKLRAENKLNFAHIFHEPTGFYMIKQFLVADYSGDKAVFLKDIETYKSVRFESARLKIAKLLYHRFMADDEQHKYPALSSVFQLLQTKKPEYKNEELSALRDGDDDEIKGAEKAKWDGQKMPTLNESDEYKDVDDDEDEKEAAKVEPPPPPTDDPDSEDEADKAAATSAPNIPVPTVPAPAPPVPVEKVKAARPPRDTNEDFSAGVTNAIGVYGRSVVQVKQTLARGEAPKDLFDEVWEEVYIDLQMDVFPRFVKSSFYQKYIRTKAIEARTVGVKDFTSFRVLGRGGFGTVYACRKNNSGALYAMKAINKKLVKVKSALSNVMEERDVLTMLNSPFVTNLKYALQDENTLYLVMDLMLGGDLKFHLINAGRFTEERARFYAAEILLGLEHIHSLSIIYRDMKLENVLLDSNGHCKLSDLGLAVVTKVKIRGYAGTPGYTAPEMIKNKPYGPGVDIFSFGVLIYRMLSGAKPFKGKIDRDLDKAVVEKEPKFPPDFFSPEATDLLTGMLQKRPEKRLGCGPRGMEEIKEHPFFQSIDWGLLEAGYLDPPFVPNKFDVNAAPLKDIGDFDMAKFKNVRLNERFKKTVKRFDWTNVHAIQEEMVTVLEKADKDVNYERFAPRPAAVPDNKSCCAVL